MIKTIIFTTGYSEDDNDITSEKGHRSDVLIEDQEGFFYELNFVDLNRLRIDLVSNKEKGINCFSDTGLVVIDKVTKDSIVKAVKFLNDEKYFTTQKKLIKEKSLDWHIIKV